MSSFVKLALVVPCAFLLIPASHVDAGDDDSCGEAAGWDATSVEAGAWCANEQPGREESSPVSMSVRWNSYCVPFTRPYQNPTVVTEVIEVQADGYEVTSTQIYSDIVTLNHIVDHPNEGVSGDAMQGQFGFMVAMGWDPTSVVGHYQVSCTGHEVGWTSGTDETSGAVHFTVVDPVPVETLRDNALAKIDFRPPGVSSAPPTSQSIVKLPSWLWVDTPWIELTDEDGQGAVLVEVFATPADVIYTFDDDEVGDFAGEGSVLCDSPGQAWTTADGDDDSDCQYTFTYPSSWNDDDVFHGTATVRWPVRWSMNGVDQGWFVDMEQMTPFDVSVVEIQSVGVATPTP